MTDSADRKCGYCTACCTIMGIGEFKKPMGVRCPHLRTDDTGCSIYQRRPTECRKFQCLWMLGQGRPEDRPDNSGIFATILDLEDLGLCRVALEVFPGAATTEYGDAALRRLAVSEIVLLLDVNLQVKQIFGSADKLEEIQQKMLQTTTKS